MDEVKGRLLGVRGLVTALVQRNSAFMDPMFDDSLYQSGNKFPHSKEVFGLTSSNCGLIGASVSRINAIGNFSIFLPAYKIQMDET
ncbi:MAG TPA: hypothetical protein VGQ39_19010 [Pyrinomonadaceae bacterium]|nr:hypothetical protein [Pyrinomonadaceae bacterium]